MTSQKQRDANRRNAQKSTGPKTTDGKNRVRYNALKHGILAKTLILPDKKIHESRDEFDFLLGSLIDDLKPVGTMQHILVEKIAVCYWRLSRVLREEAREIDYEIRQGLKHNGPYRSACALPDSERITPLTRYERTLESELNRALDRLTRLQKLNPNPRPCTALAPNPSHCQGFVPESGQTIAHSPSSSNRTPGPNTCHCEEFARNSGQTTRQSQAPDKNHPDPTKPNKPIPNESP